GLVAQERAEVMNRALVALRLSMRLAEIEENVGVREDLVRLLELLDGGVEIAEVVLLHALAPDRLAARLVGGLVGARQRRRRRGDADERSQTAHQLSSGMRIWSLSRFSSGLDAAGLASFDGITASLLEGFGRAREMLRVASVRSSIGIVMSSLSTRICR